MEAASLEAVARPEDPAAALRELSKVVVVAVIGFSVIVGAMIRVRAV